MQPDITQTWEVFFFVEILVTGVTRTVLPNLLLGTTIYENSHCVTELRQITFENEILFCFIPPQPPSDLVSMVYVTTQSSPPYNLGQIQVAHSRFSVIPSCRLSHSVLHLRSSGKCHVSNRSVI